MVNDLFKKNVITREYEALINNINSLESDLKLLTDNEILTKSNQLQKRYKDQRNLNILIAEAFALTREASFGL
jgi:preprotein translocase subunit SecA